MKKRGMVIIVVLGLAAGCSLPKMLRHEVQREAGKVVDAEFKAKADSWAFDWLTQIAPGLAAALGALGLGGFWGHAAGKKKNGNGNGNTPAK